MIALAEFLNARLDEEETRARGGDDAPDCPHDLACALVSRSGECDCGWPQALLREVEADREILAAYLVLTGADEAEYGSGLRMAIAFRAAVHSDHPDYDEAWRLTKVP
jgi:hypothetical protein